MTRFTFRAALVSAGLWSALCFMGAATLAAPRDYFGQTISEVEFRGLRTVDTSLVRRVAGIQVGTTLNAGLTQEAIRHLFALSLFSDIQIEAERAARGVKVIVVLREYPRLRDVRWEGNKKVKEDELRERVLLVPNQIVTPDQIKQAEQGILNLYKDKGYFAAQAEPLTTVAPDSALDLTFRIQEGDKVKIKKVRILGAQQLKEGEVKGKMSNREDSWFRSGNYKPDEYPQDLVKITDHYKKRGFIHAAVLHDTVYVNDTIGGMQIDIAVHEGSRYYFGATTFSGHTLFDDARMMRTLKYKPGDVFSQEKFDESKGNIYSLLQEKGRLYAQIADEQTTRDSVVDILFKVTENQPARVRFVEIRGNDKTKDKVIRRELSIFPGEIYRRSALERSVRDLMVLNYFDDKEGVVPDFRVLPNGDIDVILNVKEKSTGQISVGGGYSGQDRFVGTVGFAVPNLLGNGQSLAFNAERGSRRSSFDVSFTEPWFRDTRTSVGVDLFNINRRSVDNNYDETRSGLGVRLGRRLRFPDRYTSIFVRGRIQDVGYSDFDSTYRANFTEGSTAGPDPDAPWPQRLSSATLTLLRDSRDLAQFATRGSRASLALEYAGDAVGGFWHYHKELFEFHKYVPLYKQIALVLKAKWGFLGPTYSDEYVPFSEEFQVGGTNYDGIVRGYEEGTVGVRVESGSRDPISVPSDRPDDFTKHTVRANPSIQYDRARSMSVYNLELQFPVAPPQIYGILFFDAGRGFPNVEGWKLASDLWRSAGLGARMVVPGIGTIGFDFGYGFDDDVVGGWRPHFQIGRGF